MKGQKQVVLTAPLESEEPMTSNWRGALNSVLKVYTYWSRAPLPSLRQFFHRLLSGCCF
ncbi:hypothetical protein K0M31_007103 [Melipona bicolor]|uniref:Uncharacterized protein n=1 Tax=Melipona bicolor TaxID=60889 RepID=A0AA40FRM4_9HYME|nr:hypothetical protein K0M31_007103 [Melipona bicolor]